MKNVQTNPQWMNTIIYNDVCGGRSYRQKKNKKAKMPIESKQKPDWQFRCHHPAGLSEFDTYIIICKNDFAPHLFDIHLKYRSICRWWILFFFPHLWRIHTTNGSSVCCQFSRAADGLCAHIDSLTMPRICLCSRHEWWLCRHHHRQRRTRIVPHNRKKKTIGICSIVWWWVFGLSYSI